MLSASANLLGVIRELIATLCTMPRLVFREEVLLLEVFPSLERALEPGSTTSRLLGRPVREAQATARQLELAQEQAPKLEQAAELAAELELALELVPALAPEQAQEHQAQRQRPHRKLQVHHKAQEHRLSP